MESKKIGRPTDNPKNLKKISVRLDKESNKILEKYCKEKKVSLAEGIRRGIKELKNK